MWKGIQGGVHSNCQITGKGLGCSEHWREQDFVVCSTDAIPRLGGVVYVCLGSIRDTEKAVGFTLELGRKDRSCGIELRFISIKTQVKSSEWASPEPKRQRAESTGKCGIYAMACFQKEAKEDSGR